MPKGDQKIVEFPFRTWIVRVDEYNRVRLPLDEIRSVVPWINLEARQIECVGIPGPAGGVQVARLTDYRQDVAPFAATIAQIPPTESESSHKWMDVVRLLATAWLIPINIETSRISITLPESLRGAEQVPQAGQAAVIFGAGNILEIWDSRKWHDHVRETAKRKGPAIAEALEDLRER